MGTLQGPLDVYSSDTVRNWEEMQGRSAGLLDPLGVRFGLKLHSPDDHEPPVGL